MKWSLVASMAGVRMMGETWPTIAMPPATLIMIETEHFISIIRVIALRLQAIGADLVGQPVAAPFLIKIEQHATAMFGHEFSCAAQLVTTIAFQTAK